MNRSFIATIVLGFCFFPVRIFASELFLESPDLRDPDADPQATTPSPGAIQLQSIAWKLGGALSESGGKADCPLVIDVTRFRDGATTEILPAVSRARPIDGIRIIEGSIDRNSFVARLTIEAGAATLSNYSTAVNSGEAGDVTETFQMSLWGLIRVTYFPMDVNRQGAPPRTVELNEQCFLDPPI